MKNDYFDEIDFLYENNRNLMGLLENEKRILEKIFLDNRVPEQFKKDLIQPYGALEEIIDKRSRRDHFLVNSKEMPGCIGILYNLRQQKHMISILKDIQDIAVRRNIRILFFTIDNIDLQERSVTGTMISDHIEYACKTAIPKYIYNTGTQLKLKNKDKIKQLHMVYNVTVINPVNLFNQSVVFDILSSLSSSREFIYPSALFSPSVINDYLKDADSDSLLLIPEDYRSNESSARIEKVPYGSHNSCIIYIGGSKQTCDEEELFPAINKMLNGGKYIMMRGKKTLNWNNAPLEARIFMQKDITGEWNVTAMMAKSERFSADNTYAEPADGLEKVLLEIAPDDIETTEDLLSKYSRNICVYLDFYFPFLGSCTLDYIFAENHRPYLIGVCGVDQKNDLYRSDGKNSWNKYMNNAIDYLLYLKETKEKEA